MLENILSSLLNPGNKQDTAEKSEGGLNLVSLGLLFLLIIGGLKLLAPKTDEEQ